MDKYEFNVKAEQIKKMVSKGDYETAMKIADTIDWRRVRNVNILSMVASIYEKNNEIQEAKDILLLAFERAPIGKGLLYKLAELAVREGNTAEAQDYYNEFCELAPDDPRQHILRYLILGAKGAPVGQLIHTLEQYCNVELDEKWLYELAELYREAGMGEQCIKTCDKIMLMFGLGQYVEKAMELKQRFAPLSGYQRDLVVNRDKYEAKLKAVEQGLAPEAYEEPEPEEEYAPQPSYEEDAYPDSQDSEVYGAGEEPEDTYEPQEEEEEPEEDALSDTQEQEWEDGDGQEEEEEPEDEQEESFSYEDKDSNESDLTAHLHEAQAQEQLKKELSRLSDEPASEEDPNAQTRVLTDIRQLNRQTANQGANHLMIEAEDSGEGLSLAIEALKKIRANTGHKNQAAKITGEKLNRRGIFTLSDKLTGKDLIIEQAGDMNENILQELNQLMTRDETGMNVILIDTPARLRALDKAYPGLARRFECIEAADTHEAAQSGKAKKAPRPQKEARAVKPLPQAKAAPAKAKKAALSGKGAQPKAVTPVRKVTENIPQTEDTRPVRRVEPKRQAQAVAPVPVRKSTPAAPPKRQAQVNMLKKKTAKQAHLQEKADENAVMDIDEFAQYASQYASDIDCTISGKSMLALYERIEIMEEDGIPLTRTAAEDLIEEAADKAENPAFSKRIRGIFSSKYDKDGLLILREEHFI